MNGQSNIIFHINKIYLTNGRDINYWKDLLFTLNNNSSLVGVIDYFNQRIRNEPSNILNLDILDFLIDFSPIPLLKELSKIDLMINIFNLLRKSSGSGQEVQKKAIYLIKKWYETANKFRQENLEGFIIVYQEVNKKGIAFPPNGFKLNTYEQYISTYDINNLLSNMNFIKKQFNNKNDFNNNDDDNYNKQLFINDINNNFDNMNNPMQTPFENIFRYNNNDIPSYNMPQSNNYRENNHTNSNFNNNNYNKMNNINNNYDFYNKMIKNNNFQENNFENNNKNRIEERRNINCQNPFVVNNNNENVENSLYPENNKQENEKNNINFKQNMDTKNRKDYSEFIETPFGSKNPLPKDEPKENKKYETIYNNEFKSFMDLKYGFKKNNNNAFNNNYNNNYYNNNEENNYKFNNEINDNNQNQINNNNEPNNATYLFKNSWVVKISLYNQWMNQGSNDMNTEQLKSAIKKILNEFNEMESLLQKYNEKNDYESVSIILKLRSDMYQTCYRFERLITNQPYENFHSAFDGNIKVYNINKELILSYLDSQEHKNKYVEGLKSLGGVLKKGILTAGKVVKDNTVKGINFVKEKVHSDKNTDSNNSSKKFNNINDFSHSSDNYANNKNNPNFNNNQNDFNNKNNQNNIKSFNNQQDNYTNYNQNNQKGFKDYDWQKNNKNN